jgi:ABC-type lipoprotein export system ATPase subunit
MSPTMGNIALRATSLIFERWQSGLSVFRVDIQKLFVPVGKMVAIVGASGSGKSTLINLLSDLETPDMGEVEVDLGNGNGLQPIHEIFDHSKVGRIFQSGHLLPDATVAANLALGLASSEQGLENVDRYQLARAITQLGLEESMLDRPVWQLSGGQQQRVAIARALISNPTLIIADEPTSSLDPDLARDLMFRLRDWVREAPDGTPRTVIWVTHDYSLVRDAADLLFVMRSGRSGETVFSSLIDSSGMPSSVPRTVEEIEELVGQSSQMEHHSAQCSANSGQGWRHLDLSLALAQMLRRPTRFGEGWGDLSAVLSLKRQPVRRTIPIGAFLTRFSEWSLFFRLLMAILVMHGLMILWAIQNHQTETVLNSPANCHTMIAGTTSELNLFPGEIEWLAERPWLKPGTSRFEKRQNTASVDELNNTLTGTVVGLGCDTPLAAWPRRDLRVSAWLPLEGQNCEMSKVDVWGNRRRIGLQSVVMHRHEPALDGMIDIRGGTVGGILREQHNPREQLSVVLSQDAVVRLLQTTPDAVRDAGTICVERSGMAGGDPVLVSISAVATGLPRDGDFYFDALFPLEALETRKPDMVETAYRKVALYFQSSELGVISDFLERTADEGGGIRYRYDPDSISRFRSAVDVNRVVVSAIVLVSLFVVFGNALMVGASLTSMIQSNRRPIAMQIAMGVDQRITWGAVAWFVAIMLLIAVLVAFFVSGFFWLAALWIGGLLKISHRLVGEPTLGGSWWRSP